jgi:integrase
MRKGELEALRWDQVNLEQGIITLTDTKNHERADIPINETAKAILRTMDKNGGYVFSDEKGKLYSTLRFDFEKACKEAKISDFRVHDLRHCFASTLVMEGIDIMTVKELMRHKTLDMTLRYAHLAPNHKIRAVNILDKVMSQNPPQSEVLPKVVLLRP